MRREGEIRKFRGNVGKGEEKGISGSGKERVGN
jgi:hypothetical protein